MPDPIPGPYGSPPQIQPSQGKSVLKVVLIVFGVLTLLCVVCAGFVWFSTKELVGVFTEIGKLQVVANEKFGPQARIGYDAGTETLCFQRDPKRKDPTDAEAQDWIWTEYATRFAEGGLPVKQVAVGTEGLNSTWTFAPESTVSVDEVVQRTGKAAPPVHPKILEAMEENGGKLSDGDGVSIRIGGNADGDSGNDGASGGTAPGKDGDERK